MFIPTKYNLKKRAIKREENRKLIAFLIFELMVIIGIFLAL